jgi:hypothetical protein
MPTGNLSGQLTLFTDRGAVDVAEASGGRFGSYTQAIYDVWDDFVSRPSGKISALSAGVRERDHANESHPDRVVKNWDRCPRFRTLSCTWSV